MPACLTRSLGFAALSASASLKMDFDQNSQPIISSSSSSLRRTLSADMSSEKWKSQNGLRKIASLENLQLQDEDEDENGGPGFGPGSGAFEEIWSSIQRKQGEKKEEEETEIPRSQTDIWSSILSQKAINEKDAGETLPPPYIHPLMKRSSFLSEKSLEVCTESLGSETGSDGFSPETTSDSDMDEYKEVIVEASKETEAAPLQQHEKVVETISCSVKTKASAAGCGGSSPARCFPPPLPSLAHRGDGSNVQMRSHRQNGRLVLEAVSVPSNNCFKAEREGGRLLLIFSGRHVSDSEVADVDMEENWSTTEEEEEEVVCGEFEHGEDEEESDVEEEDDDVASGDGGTHKFLGLTRTVNSATWPRRLNKVVNDDLTSAQTGLNSYVYPCRRKPGPGPDDVAMEGKRAGKVEEEVIPLYLRGCNLQQQPRRSVLLWEPRWIAT